MTRAPMIAADHIRQLIRPYVETHTITRFVETGDTSPVFGLPKWERAKERVTIEHAPLLDQLEEAVNQSKDGDYSGGVARSKPSARLDAIAVLQRIDKDSKALARRLNLAPAPLRLRLRTIAGALNTTPSPEVTKWWVSARVVTGWDQPPYAPDVPCPNTECERRATLRVRLDQELGTCTECGSTWDESNYTQLGEYIRWASEHLRGARHWLYDGDGYPIECVECLLERQLMAERRNTRTQTARDQQATARPA